MNLMEELYRNRVIFLAANRAAQPPAAPPQAGQAGGGTRVRQQTALSANPQEQRKPLHIPERPKPETAQGAEESIVQQVYSLASPHDVSASVTFPETISPGASASEPDVWDAVLRRLETESRFRPQPFAEEEID